MKSSKHLTSAGVAALLAGAIGLAYAQTQTPMQTPMQTPTQMPSQAVDSSTPMTTPPATSAMPAPSADTSMQTERPAQADRN